MNEQAYSPPRRELPLPARFDCPYEPEYHCDVVVCGCGFAGLNAAVSAREQGLSVLVIDKGRPGYSGLAPWVSTFRWYDPQRDDADAYRKAVKMGGEYLSNLDWIDTWMRESMDMYNRLKDWGILEQYPTASDSGHFQTEDYAGYRAAFDRYDRRKKWVEVLKRYDIPYLQHTMVTDVMTAEGRVRGVMGFHVPSGQVISVHAKAVVLATGGGCVQPTGYPVGGNSFDGEYMAWQLGLPITGKEFEDFHTTSSTAPGNSFLTKSWIYLENVWLCGGDITEQEVEQYVRTKGRFMGSGRVKNAMEGVPPGDGTDVINLTDARGTRSGGSVQAGKDPDELRSGGAEETSLTADLCGAATGLCCHMTSGVFCGLEDQTGATGIGGLFVAGDGIHATAPTGASYPCGVGFASCFCSIDGDHAGRAAAQYAADADGEEIPQELIRRKAGELRAPLLRKKGFDANWARDALMGIMAPYWVSVVKDETMLTAALTQVRYMRDHVIPKLTARSGHDLRLCHEMAHKVLASELKLLASLERRESRGTTYRADYPFRDDDNFLCYITLRRDGDEIKTERVPVKPEWAGDRTLDYTKRYLHYFPGEAGAVGFIEPQEAPWKGDGRA